LRLGWLDFNTVEDSALARVVEQYSLLPETYNGLDSILVPIHTRGTATLMDKWRRFSTPEGSHSSFARGTNHRGGAVFRFLPGATLVISLVIKSASQFLPLIRGLDDASHLHVVAAEIRDDLVHGKGEV
jgi:hypothetical protein